MVISGMMPIRMADVFDAMPCCPQAISANGSALPINAVPAIITHICLSEGNRLPLTTITSNKNTAASTSRTAVSVTGGTSATPTLMNTNDDPQIAASNSSNP
jgi:hypothetical protein